MCVWSTYSGRIRVTNSYWFDIQLQINYDVWSLHLKISFSFLIILWEDRISRFLKRLLTLILSLPSDHWFRSLTFFIQEDQMFPRSVLCTNSYCIFFVFVLVLNILSSPMAKKHEHFYIMPCQFGHILDSETLWTHVSHTLISSFKAHR